MLAAAGGTALFRILVFLHVISALVGVGALVLEPFALGRHGYLGPKSRFDDVERYAIARATLGPRARVAEQALVVTLLAGTAAVAASEGAAEYTDAWVWLTGLTALTALAVLTGLLRPARNRLLVGLGGLAGLGGPPGPAGSTGSTGTAGPGAARAPVEDVKRAEVLALGRRARWGCATVEVLFLLGVVLETWQPGG